MPLLGGRGGESFLLQPRLGLWVVDLVAGAAALLDVGRRHGLIGTDATSRDDRPAGSSREAARVALRILLSGYVDPALARRPFLVAPGGKPRLSAGPSLQSVEFSLAHCEAAAIVAISTDGPVGVDIEAPRSVRISEPRRDMLIAAAATLSPADPLPSDGDADYRFLAAWVRLEALAKTTGEGLGALLGRMGDPEAPLARSRIGANLVVVRDVVIPGRARLAAAVGGTCRDLGPGDPPPRALLLDCAADALEHRLRTAYPG